MIGKRFQFLFMAMLTAALSGTAQENFCQKIRKLSRPEKCWVIGHPFIVKKTYRISLQVLAVTEEIKKDTLLDGQENGGQVDAFRHAYWMALLAKEIGAKRARKLGMKHEKGNKIAYRKRRLEEGLLPDSISSVMDISNNDIGIQIGLQYPETTNEQLKRIVIKMILKGDLKIIWRDTKGDFMDCNGEKLDMEAWRGKWNIPKCLVESVSREG